MTEAASEKVAAESEMVADESDADAEAEPLHLDCPDPNNLEALEQESEIFFRIACMHLCGQFFPGQSPDTQCVS